MALGPGACLGPYEVVSALGAGGMGEVYRARDTRLKREVALKILPGSFASDPDRLARFQREAEVLASLNHPNIAAIYGLEEGPAEAGPHVRALVMELVEGETLAERIARGPIPLDEAVPIAKQIAEALEAAHEQGIIHRDLKPANIKVRSDGTVKVLDFGLAKLAEGSGARQASVAARDAVSMSPTITSPALMTGVGVLLGTAAYMSPEQAKGRAADKRSDIWAFGCVFYEMLTGTRPFDGDDVSDTLAAVLRAAPDWTSLPGDTPALIRALLQRCLAKDRSQRIVDAATVRFVIDQCKEAATGAPKRRQTAGTWLWPGVAATMLVAFAFVAFVHFREISPPAARPVRLQVAMPDNVIPLRGAVLSPDGQLLVFPAVSADGVRRLWVRALDGNESRQLPGTDGTPGTRPFWSPDSRFVAFEAYGKLKKIEVATGQLQTLCDIQGNVLGGSWNGDGVIIFGSNITTVMRVPDAGGRAVPVTAASPSANGSFPTFLPDGRHFLYNRDERSGDRTTDRARGVFVGSLDLKEEPSARPLVEDAFGPQYVRAGDSQRGRLLFLRGATLFAQPFDEQTLSVTGEAVPLVEQVGLFNGDAMFSASESGSLVYRAGSLARPSRLTWFDRQGKQIGAVGEPVDPVAMAISPDGSKVAIQNRTVPQNITLLDVSRGVSTQLTFDRATAPQWSPDGRHVAYRSDDGISQTVTNGTGAPQVVLQSKGDVLPTDWSRDGRFLLYMSGAIGGPTANSAAGVDALPRYRCPSGVIC
jgi:eukaryotic-like serine/threonine-protein kinase